MGNGSFVNFSINKGHIQLKSFENTADNQCFLILNIFTFFKKALLFQCFWVDIHLKTKEKMIYCVYCICQIYKISALQKFYLPCLMIKWITSQNYFRLGLLTFNMISLLCCS